MYRHAEKAREYNETIKQEKRQKRRNKKNPVGAVAEQAVVPTSAFDEKYTDELKSAGYLVYLGFAAQFWQRVMTDDPLVSEEVIEHLKDAQAFFMELGYDISDPETAFPGSQDDLSFGALSCL